MREFHPLSLLTDLWHRIQGIFSDPVSAVLFLSVVAALLVGAWMLVKHRQIVQSRISQAIDNLMARLVPGRREARLNEVICPHCRRGKGILNPVYFTFQNEPHIKGTCSTCGHFVSHRLGR